MHGMNMTHGKQIFAKQQSGLSIIELMVGLAIGLVLVSGALLMMFYTTNNNYLMIVETRLNQDLRAAASLIARDLRRAGYWAQATNGVYVAGGNASLPQNNSYQVMLADRCDAATLPTPTPMIDSEVANICYYLEQGTPDNTVSDTEMFGFALQDGVISSFFGGKTPENITDPGIIHVDSLTIIPHSKSINVSSMCAAAGTLPAPPTVTVRLFEIVITGHLPSDDHVVRGIRTFAKVRNDAITGNCNS